MKKILPKLFFPVLIIGITLILALSNYKAGTYLSGWDTLHPEFNFGLYLKRTFFGAWQEHQGLGAVASQSHAGDLPRLLIYYPLSLFLPQDFLRWSYIFLSLIMGPLGIYFLVKHLTGKSWIGYSSGLVYLLNLGTLQMFYLPLEMFATHFASLPWLFLFAVKFLATGSPKNLFLLSLITLFASSVSHTPTLFYVYFFALILFLFADLVIHRSMFWKFGGRTTRAFLIIFATLTINSFWLLPNVYFIVNHGKEVLNSKIHSQLYNRAFYTSKAFATIEDASLVKGYLFDWGRYDFARGKFVDLFFEWKAHLNNPLVLSLGKLIFLFVLLGIVTAIVNRQKIAIAFLPVFLLSLLALASNFEFLSSFEILREALRFHFTKFSIILMFTFSIYFGVFLEFLGKNKLKYPHIYLPIFVTLALVYYMLPAFSGNLISSSVKVKIPEQYFEAFNFLNSKEGRVANFPVNTYWSWAYYSWGYEGAGFLWFGLKNPLMDREFDRWSSYNENYYWEVSYALYSRNLGLLESVLSKYQIKWLFVDGNVISPSSLKSVYTDEMEALVSDSQKLKLSKSFGKIQIYEVKSTGNIASPFVYMAQNLPSVGPAYEWTNYDRAYIEKGDYINSPFGPSAHYPFRSLFSGRNPTDLEIKEDSGNLYFSEVLPVGYSGYYLEVPQTNSSGLVSFDGKTITVTVPKTAGQSSAEIIPAGKRDFWLNSLPNYSAYLVSVESSNIKGVPINFWLENLNSRRIDMESYLPARPINSIFKPVALAQAGMNTAYFIQPPMEKDGVGYGLHFEQLKFGREVSENKLGVIKVNPIPFDFMTGLKLVKKPDTKPQKIISVEAKHPNPSLYIVNNSSTESATLVLSQAYEKGWRAYNINFQFSIFSFQFDDLLPFIFGKEIKTHVMVNNWANGWELEGNNQKIVVVFLPQYLEYLGFVLLLGYFGWLARISKTQGTRFS